MSFRKQLSKLDINIIFISIFIALVCYYGYWDQQHQSFIAHDEGIYVGRAKKILETNSWFTPFQEPHHKTVGSYWLIALSIKLFGLSEFSARLPSGIFSILSSVSVYLISKEFISQRASLLAALLLPSMPLWLQYSRYASPDIAFIFFLLLSYLCLIRAYKNYSLKSSSPKLLIVISGFSIGIAFFIRSFMVVLPLFAIAPFIFSIRKFWTSSHLRMLSLGLSIGLIPSILGIILSINNYGVESIHSLIGFAGNKAVGGSFLKSLLFYPLNIITLAFPLSFYSILGIRHIKQKQDSVTINYFIIYPLIVIASLSLISSRHSHYSLIIYPHIAMLYGFAVDTMMQNGIKLGKKDRLSLAIPFILVGLLLTLLGISGWLGIDLISFDVIHDIQPIISLLGLLYAVFGLTIALNLFTTRPTMIFFSTICACQMFAITNFYATGIMGNPNKDFKDFATSSIIQDVSKNNIIYLFDINGKVRTLSQAYLPNYVHIRDPLSNLEKPLHVIIEQGRLNDLISENVKYDNLKVLKLSSFKEWNFLKIIDN